jgi:hypothetical protein
VCRRGAQENDALPDGPDQEFVRARPRFAQSITDRWRTIYFTVTAISR